MAPASTSARSGGCRSHHHERRRIRAMVGVVWICAELEQPFHHVHVVGHQGVSEILRAFVRGRSLTRANHLLQGLRVEPNPPFRAGGLVDLLLQILETRRRADIVLDSFGSSSARDGHKRCRQVGDHRFRSVRIANGAIAVAQIEEADAVSSRQKGRDARRLNAICPLPFDTHELFTQPRDAASCIKGDGVNRTRAKARGSLELYDHIVGSVLRQAPCRRAQESDSEHQRSNNSESRTAD